MENNIRVLPKWIPDEECKALIAWVDSLTIGHLQDLRNLHIEVESSRLTIEKYRKMLAKLLDDKITWSAYSKTCDEARAALGEEK